MVTPLYMGYESFFLGPTENAKNPQFDLFPMVKM